MAAYPGRLHSADEGTSNARGYEEMISTNIAHYLRNDAS